VTFAAVSLLNHSPRLQTLPILSGRLAEVLEAVAAEKAYRSDIIV
jgi:hypothetical protein